MQNSTAFRTGLGFGNIRFFLKGTISPTHSLRFEGDVKTAGPMVVVHPTSFDGVVEMAAVQLGFGVSAAVI